MRKCFTSKKYEMMVKRSDIFELKSKVGGGKSHCLRSRSFIYLFVRSFSKESMWLNPQVRSLMKHCSSAVAFAGTISLQNRADNTVLKMNVT